MKKKAALAAAVMIMIAGVIPAAAAVVNIPAKGGKISFDKYLVLDENLTIPDVSFGFTVDPAEAREYDAEGKTIEILKPSATASPSNMTAEFSSADETWTAIQEGDLVKSLAAGQKYAKKELTLDFSDVSFSNPGVYRFLITEEGTNAGVINDENPLRAVDVYVINSAATPGDYADTALKVAGYVFHDSEDAIPAGEHYGADGSEPANKNVGYTNAFYAEDLAIAKEVSGNQASVDKYFKIHVEMKGLSAGASYSVDLSKAHLKVIENNATDPSYVGKNNPGQITAAADGTASADFYLQGKQSVVIREIPHGAEITVKETEEDYTPSQALSGDAKAGAVLSEAAVVINKDTKDPNMVAFTNTREGVIPTGVIVPVIPYVLLVAAAIIGIWFTRKKKK